MLMSSRLANTILCLVSCSSSIVSENHFYHLIIITLRIGISIYIFFLKYRLIIREKFILDMSISHTLTLLTGGYLLITLSTAHLRKERVSSDTHLQPNHLLQHMSKRKITHVQLTWKQ